MNERDQRRSHRSYMPDRTQERRYQPDLVPISVVQVSGYGPNWFDGFGADFGADPRRRRSPFRQEFGPAVKVGENMTLRVRKGFRAAIQKLDEGQYLVSEVREEVVDPVVGFLPLLAPAMVINAVRNLLPQKDDAEHRFRLFKRRDDESDEIEPIAVTGCNGRACNCRGGR